jgi:hypothetical protein
MKPIFPVVIAAVLAACPVVAVAQSQSQKEEIVVRTFAGKSVRLVIPSGYCLMDRDSPAGRPFYELRDQINQGTRVVGAIFADCKEWAQSQATPSYRIRRHGTYLFQLWDGKEALYPPRYTREEFLREFSRLEFEGKGVAAQASSQLDKLNQELAKGIAETEVRTRSSVEPVNVGLIAINEYAAFHGMGMTVKYPTESRRVSLVMATTFLDNGVPVFLNLYADYDPKDVFKRLLDQQERNAKRLVEENR